MTRKFATCFYAHGPDRTFLNRSYSRYMGREGSSLQDRSPEVQCMVRRKIQDSSRRIGTNTEGGTTLADGSLTRRRPQGFIRGRTGGYRCCAACSTAARGPRSQSHARLIVGSEAACQRRPADVIEPLTPQHPSTRDVPLEPPTSRTRGRELCRTRAAG